MDGCWSLIEAKEMLLFDNPVNVKEYVYSLFTNLCLVTI